MEQRTIEVTQGLYSLTINKVTIGQYLESLSHETPRDKLESLVKEHIPFPDDEVEMIWDAVNATFLTPTDSYPWVKTFNLEGTNYGFIQINKISTKERSAIENATDLLNFLSILYRPVTVISHDLNHYRIEKFELTNCISRADLFRNLDISIFFGVLNYLGKLNMELLKASLLNTDSGDKKLDKLAKDTAELLNTFS